VEKHPTHPRESTLAMVCTCPTYMWDKYIGNGYEIPSEMETLENTLVLVINIVVILSWQQHGSLQFVVFYFPV